MKILYIAYYTVLRNFRDKRSQSLTLLFPILLILILGSALKFAYEPSNISRIKVAYYSKVQNDVSNHFESFLESKGIKDIIQIEPAANYEQGIKLLKDKKVSSFIYIPVSNGNNSAVTKKPSIEVYQNEGDALNASIIRNVLNSYVNGANTVFVLYSMGAKNINYKVYENIKEMPITTKGTVPRAIDYYAVTMLALTLMYGALFGSFSMSEDIKGKTYIRIKSSPTSPYTNYLGKTLGTIVTLIIQMCILVMFTKYVYHANWGSNLGMIFFLGVIFSVLTTALGIMAFALTNDATRASGVINILVVFFTFISGGYAKINADGTWFEKFSYISPNKLFQTAVFNTIYGGPSGQTNLCIAALIGLIVIMFTVSSIAGRRNFD